MSRICAFTDLKLSTRISGQVYGFKFVKMLDSEHYWRTINEEWKKGEGLTILEHDLLAWGIRSLENCPEPWCVRPYNIGGLSGLYMREGLGCTRFSKNLTKLHPNLVELTADKIDMGSGIQIARDWGSLDSRLAWVLHNHLGLKVHSHFPTLHFHKEQ